MQCVLCGGIDNNENLYTALRHEIQEEVGCEINITGELGMCIEYIGDLDLVSISYVFVAEKTIQTEQRLTKEEIDAGFALEWHTIEETFKLIEKTETSDKRGGQQMKREMFLLKYFWENNQNKI